MHVWYVLLNSTYLLNYLLNKPMIDRSINWSIDWYTNRPFAHASKETYETSRDWSIYGPAIVIKRKHRDTELLTRWTHTSHRPASKRCCCRRCCCCSTVHHPTATKDLRARSICALRSHSSTSQDYSIRDGRSFAKLSVKAVTYDWKTLRHILSSNLSVYSQPSQLQILAQCFQSVSVLPGCPTFAEQVSSQWMPSSDNRVANNRHWKYGTHKTERRKREVWSAEGATIEAP